VRTVILYLTLVINVIAMFSTIVGVLLHSGQGGGLGSAAAERNLNRITAVFATVWLFTVVALAFLLSN
jgi:preprotein translocase subunit SecG